MTIRHPDIALPIRFFPKRWSLGGMLCFFLFWALSGFGCLTGKGASELFFVQTVQAASVNDAYEKAKRDMAELERHPRRSQWRDQWQKIAAVFMDLYTEETTWNNRPAALFRSALAIDEMARRSVIRKDVVLAESRYLLLVRKHSSSVLADDALYKAACLRLDVLKDTSGADALLQQLIQKYPGGDMAPEAKKLRRSLSNEPSPEKSAPKSDKQVVPPRKEPPPSKPLKPVRLPVKTVLIDAGHGGKDPGTRHHNIVERNVTLDLAKRVGAILASEGMRVEYTRFSNKWISLDDRAALARKTRADLIISIHVNANPSEAIHGFETYYFDSAKTSAAARLAAVENAMNGHAFQRLGKVPADRLLGIQTQASRRLARAIQRATLAYLEKKKYKTRDGGIKTAPFMVLRRAGVPGVLVEVGYCTHKTEARKLGTSAYRAALARGIATGILIHARKK